MPVNQALDRNAAHMTTKVEIRKERIRKGFVLSCVVAISAAAAGFYGGEWWAQYEAQKLQERTIQAVTLSQEVANLYMLQAVLDSLRADRPRDGELALLRYAKLKVGPARECHRSVECTFLTGTLLPSEAKLNELEAMPER